MRTFFKRAYSAGAPAVTLHRPSRFWLDSPINLHTAPLTEIQTLHAALVGEPPVSSTHAPPPNRLIEEICATSFQACLDKVHETPPNYAEARSLLSIAVFHKFLPAKLYAARLLLAGEWSTQTNLDVSPKEKGMEAIREIRRIQKATKRGEYHYPTQPPKDVYMALQLLREIAPVSGEALLEIGDVHFFPPENVSDNTTLVSEQEALQAYEQAAEMKTPKACYRLGCALYELHQVDRALTWFRNAVEREQDGDAMVFLGHFYKSTLDQQTEGRRLLETAAETKNNDEAMVYLARWDLEEGRESSALDYLQRAAKLDNAEALHLLADAYVHGSYGLEMDLPKAYSLYVKAGEVGHLEEAWLSAGALCYSVFEDFENCFQCYTQATKCGDSPEAWKRLADLYITGKGVERNEETGTRILQMLGQGENTG